MDWFLVFCFIMGVLVSVAASRTAVNVKRAIRAEDDADILKYTTRVDNWLFTLAFLAISESVGFSIKIVSANEDRINALNARIDRVENHLKDTVVVDEEMVRKIMEEIENENMLR